MTSNALARAYGECDWPDIPISTLLECYGYQNVRFDNTDHDTLSPDMMSAMITLNACIPPQANQPKPIQLMQLMLGNYYKWSYGDPRQFRKGEWARKLGYPGVTDQTMTDLYTYLTGAYNRQSHCKALRHAVYLGGKVKSGMPVCWRQLPDAEEV
jgi:hypothetical protein